MVNPERGTELTSDPEWLSFLNEGHKPLLRLRAVMRRLPSDPRCKVCANPFGGAGGKLTRLAGFKPSPKNPNLCGMCENKFEPGGALVDVAVLFADVRGSTAFGEQVGAAQFAATMGGFYKFAMGVLLNHNAVIDKLLGDEVMALFVRGVAGADYRGAACRAGLTLVRQAAGRKDLPAFGVAVHAGPAFVGNVGASGVVDFTALGDTVNTAARLQGVAEPGQLVISESLWSSVDLGGVVGEGREVTLKGKAEPLAVRVVSG